MILHCFSLISTALFSLLQISTFLCLTQARYHAESERVEALRERAQIVVDMELHHPDWHRYQ